MAVYRNEVSTMNTEFLHEAIQGLQSTPKRLSPKFFYDQRGSELFEKICSVKEYYPTRLETQILKDSVAEISEKLGPQCLLFEFGSGSSTKTRVLLDELKNPAAYLPIDISGDFLEDSVDRLRDRYPGLMIVPICADFTRDVNEDLSAWKVSFPFAKNKVGFLPGSTLGNFTPEEAQKLLSSIAGLLGPEGQLLVGIDLVKEPSILEAAYNDSEGATAEFNLNVLRRMVAELEAKIDLENFYHHAFFNPKESRIEMHLISRKEQIIEIGGAAIHFEAGESIHTENSYKYTPKMFEKLASQAGFENTKMWTDPKSYFGVFLLTHTGFQTAELEFHDSASAQAY
jgi:dimethylhistidine N-methyltransferase